MCLIDVYRSHDEQRGVCASTVMNGKAGGASGHREVPHLEETELTIMTLLIKTVRTVFNGVYCL